MASEQPAETPNEATQDISQQDRQDMTYVYIFKSRNKKYYYVQNFGHGNWFQAQLVQNSETGDRLVRSVQINPDSVLLNKPDDIVIPNTIKAFLPQPDIPCNIPECYGYDCIEIPDDEGRMSYRQRNLDTIPSAAVGRMIWQVLGTLHFMYTGGPRPVLHNDINDRIIWMHWNAHASEGETAAEDPLPDFLPWRLR
ncbi:hypothetical protein B0H66DRAFT_598287 [Apodospora peruviana]|uniref:Protein kinase domain-containing protein n=1 Tax=Apodospora peruviana TaxID=516989 RepID=A0AAE0IT17_9PEZI|nr:hypothetical protein B0H66DRAFT_598287 [Apodospora peruviana]